MIPPDAVLDTTRRWISTVVIGLDLCPFAGRVFHGDKIRYVVSPAADAVALLDDLTRELRALASHTTFETTLLIHPNTLHDFLDYNDFLGDADQLLRRLRLRGTIQLASFHPDYVFADTDPDAVENYTNRSPYPMLHLLREESITAVADLLDDPVAIPRRNVETLRRLGKPALLQMLREITAP